MATSSSPGGDKAAAGKTGFSLKQTIVELLLVTLIAIGAGALLATLNPPSAKPPEPTAGPKTAEGGGGAKKEPACTGASNLMDLPPIVTNLAMPNDNWIRVEASIVFDAKAMPHPEVVAAEIATDELAYLRTLSLAELQGPIGLENLRQDLGDRAVIRSGGKVSEFILKTLVVQ